MTTKENRLAAKQVDAPEAVLGVRKEDQPGGARGTRESGRQVLREHAAYDIFIDLDAEGVRDQLGNALIAESGVTKLNFDDRRDEFRRGTLGPGLSRVRAEENSQRYLRSTSALWNRNNVAGLRIAASFATRRGRTNSIVNPSTNRSNVVKGGNAPTGTAADDQLMLQEQGLGDDGVESAGSRPLGDGDDKLKREEKQVTHPEEGYQGCPAVQDCSRMAPRDMICEFATHTPRQRL